MSKNYNKSKLMNIWHCFLIHSPRVLCFFENLKIYMKLTESAVTIRPPCSLKPIKTIGDLCVPPILINST